MSEDCPKCGDESFDPALGCSTKNNICDVPSKPSDKAIISFLCECLVKTVLPLEVLVLSGSSKNLSEELQQAVSEGIAAAGAGLKMALG